MTHRPLHSVQITYCKPCGYLSRAQHTADTLRTALGVGAELVAGRGGVFEVAVGGRVVAARSRKGFPPDEAILAAVARAMAR